MNKNKIEALKFISEYTKEKNYPPNFREIGKHIGLSSSSTVHKLLKNCQDEGLLDIEPNISRSTRVSPLGMKYLKKQLRVGWDFVPHERIELP